MKARERKHTIISFFNKAVNQKTDINPNWVRIVKTCLEYMSLNLQYCLISQNISADLKGPKVKYKLPYGRCTGLFLRAALISTKCHLCQAKTYISMRLHLVDIMFMTDYTINRCLII